MRWPAAILTLIATPALAQQTYLPLVNIPGQYGDALLPQTSTLLTQTPTTSSASINLPPGTAPSSPNNGDLWNTSAGLFVQVAGATIGPLGPGGSGSLPTISSGTLLGNSTSGSATAAQTTLTALIDRAIGSTQGEILYRSATAWVPLAPGTSGQFLQTQGSAANPQWATAGGTANQAIADPTMLIDGGGSAIQAGAQRSIYVDFACTISQVTILADQPGSLVVDLWLVNFAGYPTTSASSIVASDPPTLSSAQKSQDSTLTGWSKTIPAGSTITYHVNSASTVTWATVTVKCIKS